MQKIELSKAIEALQNGDIVVYPTDTLYAFGVDVYNKDAVKKVFEVKKRPL
ncbi:MAG: Sua5/YciO/YrdC/YwlC family protein, partial [Thermoplasmatales archaeon]|nr:Sua5/YciO/YrdC/YwlC family protein [Thermoplasmatales archaeon]